ncbi:beta-ketoacyl synthase N-terminal-like domain-containing protein [Streptomyces sp. CRN 30]|uniref:beta-ketoacyl synthase N-terminal-like domain-containing protein n=1 Tax=Streptomyces sp. CRN 30 TaxID=3075613 RepID=UPI002A7EE245|nr:beta-ketoacyl synthase N-terminal-like domain-containing protein [Streptomyces sp. CRN 30]
MSAADPVAVTGLGVLSPGGAGVDALWRACAEGDVAFRTVAHFDASRTGAHRVGLVPEEATEPGAPPPGHPQRLPYLVHRAVADAVADAGTRGGEGAGGGGTRTVLVLGTTDGGGFPSGAAWRAWHEGRGPAGASWTPYAPPGPEWPVVRVGNASAAGATALGVGADLLRAGIADRAVVCGADTVTETAFHGLASLRTLSPGGCRPFAARRSGIRISECAAAVVLERRARAPLVRLRGWGGSNAASQAARPDVEGIASAVRRALADAGTAPEEIEYVNAHAAGTRHGDVAELGALHEVLGARLPRVPVVSSKAALGHCQGAAGTVEAIVTVLTLLRGRVLPTLGLADRDPRWAHLDLGGAPPSHPPRTALTLSCGLGGSNVAVVFDRAT